MRAARRTLPRLQSAATGRKENQHLSSSTSSPGKHARKHGPGRNLSGRSSAVERDVANVDAVGSIPIARSSLSSVPRLAAPDGVAPASRSAGGAVYLDGCREWIGGLLWAGR